MTINDRQEVRSSHLTGGTSANSWPTVEYINFKVQNVCMQVQLSCRTIYLRTEGLYCLALLCIALPYTVCMSAAMCIPWFLLIHSKSLVCTPSIAAGPAHWPVMAVSLFRMKPRFTTFVPSNRVKPHLSELILSGCTNQGTK